MDETPSALIEAKIASLTDWRGPTLARLRALMREADPDVVEEVKWRKPSNPSGVPVWSHGGIICTGETYKAVVKMTFAKGASLKDPSKLFNASLEGNMRRAIDITEGAKIDGPALKSLIRAAAALNAAGKKKPAKTSAAKPSAAKPSAAKPSAAKASAAKPSAAKTPVRKARA